MSDLTEEMRRHSAAHLTARAVQNVFEDVQVDIGPATDDGFYYDFDLPHRLSLISQILQSLCCPTFSFSILQRQTAQHNLL